MSTQSGASDGHETKSRQRATTWLIDIDGTIFEKSPGDATGQWFRPAMAVNKAREFINACEKQGDMIILITARKECLARETIEALKTLGFYWDKILFGVTNGPRIVINDGPCGHLLVKPNGGFNAWDYSSWGSEHPPTV